MIVRVSSDESGRISGVVERVRTGQKRRFHGIDTLGPMIVQMVGEETGVGVKPGELDDPDAFRDESR